MLDFPDFPVVGQVFNGHRSSWIWDGVKWDVSSAHPRYVVACFVPDKLKADQSLLLHRFSKAVTFPIEFGDYLGHSSEMRGGFAATTGVTVSLLQATELTPGVYATVGSGTVVGGSLLGTLTTFGIPLNFVEGDTLAIVAPTVPDATFGDFACTLVGFET
jgi:hypothetical protein